MTAISFRREYRLKWRQLDGTWKPAGPGFADLARAAERARDLEGLDGRVVDPERGRVVLAAVGGFGGRLWQRYYALGCSSRRPIA